MKRVNANCLKYKKKRYYYLDELFTGIGFELKKSKIIKKIIYKDGLSVGPYINEYFPDIGALEHVDMDFLEEDETHYSGEPFSYNGSVFTGIAYEFRNDFCISEVLYKNGLIESDIGYFESGALEAMDIHENNFSQKFVWNIKNDILKIRLFKKDCLDFTLEFDENYHINKLILQGEYFDTIDQLREKTFFPGYIYEQKSFLNHISAAENLYLSGNSISDDVFEELFINGGLEKTETLFIYHTQVTTHTIDSIGALENLRELRIRCNLSDDIMEKSLQYLKKKSSDITIILNDEEVT